MMLFSRRYCYTKLLHCNPYDTAVPERYSSVLKDEYDPNDIVMQIKIFWMFKMLTEMM